MTTTIRSAEELFKLPEVDPEIRRIVVEDVRALAEKIASNLRRVDVDDVYQDAAALLEWATFLLSPPKHERMAQDLRMAMAADLDLIAHGIAPGGFVHDDDNDEEA